MNLPVTEIRFYGDFATRVDQGECAAIIRHRAHRAQASGVIHWPEPVDDESPVAVLEWRWCSDRQRIICEVIDFETSMEVYEENRRRKIAEANER